MTIPQRVLVQIFKQTIETIQIEKQMKKVSKTFRQGVASCDLFCVTDLMRYSDNSDYRSFAGGMCSLAMVILFAIVFTNVVVDTFNKQTIYTVVNTEEDQEPTYFSSDTSSFMFAIGLQGIDMNDPTQRYFDINFSQRSNYAANSTRARTYYDLVQCQKQSWSKINSSLGQTFTKLGLDQWLCLPENLQAEFQGKYSSQIFKYMKLSVEKCSNTSTDTRPCVSDADIDSHIATYGSFTFNFYFVNTIVNPHNKEYVSYYLQDRNYFTFTKQSGTIANIFTSSYTINSDVSLWPIKEWTQDVGGFVKEETQTFSFVPSTQYIELYLRKSSQSVTYTRSFLKYDGTLSYIGGLFSSIMAFLFFMQKYNECSYQIQIGSKTYTKKDKSQIQSNLNIFSYIKYQFYNIADFFNKPPQWKQIKAYEQNRSQISKNLDTGLIMRRLMFLEDCMTYLFEDYQLNCLHLKNKVSIAEAVQMRQKYDYYPRFVEISGRGKEQQGSQDGSNSQFMMIFKDKQIANDFKQNNNHELKQPPINQSSPNNPPIQTMNSSITPQEIQALKNDQQFMSKMIENLNQLKLNSQTNQRAQRIMSQLQKDTFRMYEKMKTIKEKGGINTVKSRKLEEMRSQLSRQQSLATAKPLQAVSHRVYDLQ